MNFGDAAVYGNTYKTGIVVCQFSCLIYNALSICIDVKGNPLIVQIFYYVPHDRFREWVASGQAYFDKALFIEFINDSLIIIQCEF